ncbi:DNA (cytosine-5-)-methyltransferase [Mammaliicoccus sciuri]|uniref:DNA (cytosine-5-)-methyltransferase n=1 Tax=Mammaliicoccus sciuri TaxID=1296 RepID=UPI000B1A536A|nr:DNA (cytosine-5-)-methyltransferase [Mammaliicoccus sciuri]MCD8884870.1 DNA (cytosine-5-)-methyltransferase [Mammaliicoccus sciuri]MDO0958115.1 DNA (cytosine-5-)-methyltransferase [Mammaliicoccus sciuri]MDT0708336.1 DNA (cytosine-5-)-methyltransferase [Mammaliicoccus sciuri]MDU0267017.1 DNA (cytosine-5-)-methyltransferase [Mammaliicoccus sciuri]MEB6097058.1 DNA (cytosine-5-)-methyltransferase [Mammaliicoccus sciuri]
MTKEMKVLELFAGVGGFRVGLEKSSSTIFKTKWANQWEPSRKSQDAFEVYDYHYPNSQNFNINIEDITDDEFSNMDADIIVGGFPCQDYSVARSKKNELGIEGKKGVLFWQIIRATNLIKPKYLILENVDRLLKAPSKQRGRDFAIMLAAFNDLGYSVEWRVINAADYGRGQRRKRVFFFIYKNDTIFAQNIDKKFHKDTEDLLYNENQYDEYIFKDGLFAKQFPIKQTSVKNRHASYEISKDIVKVSNNFTGKVWNTGVMRYGKYFTIETEPIGNEKPLTLSELIQDVNEVNEKYYLSDEAKLEKFKYLRGPKKIERTTTDGYTYLFSEGGMSPFDDLNLPGRTMLTSEGSVNRSTHLLNINNRYRLLTPIEAERLQDFPDDWTKYKKTSNGEIQEVSDRMRMFFMGNALVTGIVKRIGDGILKVENS